MTGERKTLVLAVTSWVLPAVMAVVPFIVKAICPVSELKSVIAIKTWAIAVFGTVIGALVVALILAVKARRRSRTLHDGRFYGHASAGLVANLCLLFGWGLVAAFLLWDLLLE